MEGSREGGREGEREGGAAERGSEEGRTVRTISDSAVVHVDAGIQGQIIGETFTQWRPKLRYYCCKQECKR